MKAVLPCNPDPPGWVTKRPRVTVTTTLLCGLSKGPADVGAEALHDPIDHARPDPGQPDRSQPASAAVAYRVCWEAAVTLAWPAPDSREGLSSRGLKLETITWGFPDTADLTLVCLHGYLDCAASFAPLAHEVRQAARRHGITVALTAMTFAGHAGSDRADSYGWFDHTVDVIGFLDRNRARSRKGRIVAVGHSFGAVQMLEALRIDPTSIEFCVNLDALSNPFAPESGSMGEALAKAASGALRNMPLYASLDDLVARRRAYNPRLSDETLRHLVRHLAVHTDDGWMWRVDPALVGWIRPWDLAGSRPTDPLVLSAQLPLEVLTITGDAQDEPRIRGPHPGNSAIQRVPNIIHISVPSSGHYVHLEAAIPVASAVVAHALGLEGRHDGQ